MVLVTMVIPQLQVLLFVRSFGRQSRSHSFSPFLGQQMPQVQFLRGGGRRCAHAAMRSSCRS